MNVSHIEIRFFRIEGMGPLPHHNINRIKGELTLTMYV